MEKYYYNLSYILYSPAESTEPDKYMAEAQDIPGCRAWGDTPEETIEIRRGRNECPIAERAQSR